MTTPFRSIPAAVLAGASAVLGGAARIAMFGARALDPRWRRDEPAADQPLPTPDLPAPGADDPDADRDLATLTGAGAEGSGLVEDIDVDGDGVPDAVVVVVDEDGDGVADGAMAATVVDRDGDGEADAVVAVLDVDGDGVVDDVLVVTAEDEAGEDEAGESEAGESEAGAGAGDAGAGDGEAAGEGVAEAPGGVMAASVVDGDGDGEADAVVALLDVDGDGLADDVVVVTADDAPTGSATEGAPEGADLSGTGVDLGAAAGAGAGPEGDADALGDVTGDDGEVDVYAAEHADDAPAGAAALIDPDAALAEPMGAETLPADPPAAEAGEDGFAVAAVGDEDLLGGDLAPAPVVDDVPTQEHRDDQGTDDPGDDRARRPESHVAEIAERPVATVVREIATLSTDELEALFEYESTHRKRKTVLQAIERATAPQGE